MGHPSELTYMKDMFFGSKFNRDISQWDVNKVCNFEAAFYNSDFDQNVNCWDFGECGTYGAKVQGMFGGTSKYSRVFCQHRSRGMILEYTFIWKG